MQDCNPIVYVSFIRAYQFEGWLFEYNRNKPFGPWPLKKDYEPRARAGKKFYDMFARWEAMSIEDQEKCRVL